MVGIFANDRSLIRLAASVVIEQNDWLVGRRYLSAHSLEAVLNEEKERKRQRGDIELTAA